MAIHRWPGLLAFLTLTPPSLPAAVGMEISVPLFFAKFKTIMLAMALLIGGKVAVMTAVGQAFGLTLVQSMRRLVVLLALLLLVLLCRSFRRLASCSA